jgi:HD-GYP domain-containing protein (c-di-GMP phosphodiesterase class II)
MRQRPLGLIGVNGASAGQRWQSEALLRIGRQDGLEVVLDHPSVSRQHAELVIREWGGLVRDLGSMNGTFLNGARIGQTFVRLKADDLVQCGEVVLRVVPLPEAGRGAVLLGTGDHCELKLSHIDVEVQAATQRSWAEAVSAPTAPAGGTLLKGNSLLGLLRMGQYLSHMQSLDNLLQLVLDDTVAVLDAQRGCILLAQDGSSTLDLRTVSFSSRPNSTSHTFSRTLAAHCIEQGKSLLCRDANLDRSLSDCTSITHGSMASIICAIIRTPRSKLGVLHLDRGPFQEPFSQADLDLADTIAAHVSIGIENAQLAETQRDLFLHTVSALAQAVEMRDHYTGNHTQRVTRYALMVAHELGLGAAELQQLRIATPLHDIGKIAIDDAILRKPGKLTPEEFEQMKSHVLRGAAILEPIPGMSPMLPIVRNHHERWDGQGYPDQLAGDRIPVLARIVGVADAFDAMTSDRPYRPAFGLERAFQEVSAQAGTQFDPDCVRAFERLRHHVQTAFAVTDNSLDPFQGLADTHLQAEVHRLLHTRPSRVGRKTVAASRKVNGSQAG